MPHSSVTLFYGLWVKTWSLAFAAETYYKTKPVLLAIDLILLRRRKGNLVAEAQDSKTTARDLPEEVWQLVKQELIDEVLWDEELAALKRYRCPTCDRQAGDADRRSDIVSSQGLKSLLWTRWGTPSSCPSCYVTLEAVSPLVWFEHPASCNNVEELLSNFDLHMISSVTWKQEQEPGMWTDFYEQSAIAIPLQALKKCSPGLSDSPVLSINAGLSSDGYDSFSNSKVLSFSPEALRLPSNAELRFRRLVSTYRLQVVDRVKSTITSSSLPPSTTDDSAIGASSQLETKTDEFGKEEPRWMLWSLAQPWD
ncbi:hypothetical protein BCR35DRAFT_351611 [Leucosporidium creatinivorum]|uniref:Uncharacterized protein n=1 Tax=Leucosporidium creatinivorum TaxID=106004 RepID=A0A1Y2FR63_9BASI|nr:hypothetical protein BCR35DRAFT_351611 [Leucosporidium creatinivorum]